MSETAQLVTFHLGSYSFGVDVTSVQEILRARALTHVPLAHAAVVGLLNLRGQIVTVIDLRERLAFPGASADESGGMNVVARAADGAVSFRVDGVGDVLTVDPANLEPATSVSGSGEFVTGLYKLADRVIHVLDIEKVAAFSSSDLTTFRPPTEGKAHGN